VRKFHPIVKRIVQIDPPKKFVQKISETIQSFRDGVSSSKECLEISHVCEEEVGYKRHLLRVILPFDVMISERKRMFYFSLQLLRLGRCWDYKLLLRKMLFRSLLPSCGCGMIG